jgi:HAD superfamily hydrolase (TIGR01549 family)
MLTQISSISTLLFDWDGTIVDSALLGLAAYERAFAELDVVFSHEIYEASYSPNWCAVYQALGLPEEQWERADSLWRFHYDSQTPQLIEGAAATLIELRARGYQLGVVTSGNNDRVQREVEQFDLAELFETMICHEHIKHRKPHPEGLEIALARLGSGAAETAYVGDAPEDIQMGKRANIMTVGVRSDYPTSARLRDEAPDICLESIVELATHFPGVSKLE